MNNFPNQTAKYYMEVAALSPKETTVVSKNLPSAIENSPLNILFSPLLIYVLIVFFIVLFLGSIIIQIIQRVLTWKSTITTLIVVFILTAIPFTLKTALQLSSIETKAAPDEIPKNVQINQIFENTVEVSWITDSEKLGSVRIGKSPLDAKESKNIIADNGKKNNKHKVQIPDLKKGIIYDIEILSGNMWYNRDGSPIQFELK